MALARTTAAVLDSLRGEPDGLTRAELVQRSHLSRPTVSAVVSELRDQGLLRDVAGQDGPDGAGRVTLSPASGLFVGIDLGHGHVAAAIGTGAANVLAGPRSRGAIDVDHLGLAALEPAMELVRELLISADLHARDVVGLGVGVPAPLTWEGTVASSHYLGSFVGVDIADQVLIAFQATFATDLAPLVTCENDANLGALGETSLGVARGRRNVVYIKASSGIGAGILVDGEIWRGAHGLAGEFGHTRVCAEDEDDLLSPVEKCPRCEQDHCLENTVSAGALLNRLRKLDQPAYADENDFDKLLDTLLDEPSRHQRARKILLHAGGSIGTNLADVVRVLDPEAVILGGKLARAGTLVGQPIADAMARAAIGRATTEVLLVESEQVPFSEARGAMMLAIRRSSARLVRG